MLLKQLHQGIAVPEYSVIVPWLASKRTLYEYIPRKHFRFAGTAFPLLRFTCLGIHADFGFNFASHPEGGLIELQMNADDAAVPTTDGVPTQLLATLGAPIRQDTNDFLWKDDQIVVNCWVCVRRRKSDDPFVYEFSKLEIRYSVGWDAIQ